jgi:hypothetical protein
MLVPWDVEFSPDCEVWADGLSPEDQEALLAAIIVFVDWARSSAGRWSTRFAIAVTRT